MGIMNPFDTQEAFDPFSEENIVAQQLIQFNRDSIYEIRRSQGAHKTNKR